MCLSCYTSFQNIDTTNPNKRVHWLQPDYIHSVEGLQKVNRRYLGSSRIGSSPTLLGPDPSIFSCEGKRNKREKGKPRVQLHSEDIKEYNNTPRKTQEEYNYTQRGKKGYNNTPREANHEYNYTQER